jgi:hypothetical protein
MTDNTVSDTTVATSPPDVDTEATYTVEDLVKRLAVLDHKVTWMCQTLEWMSGIFQGLQSVAAMMPGKTGKAAREMMSQTQQGQGGVPHGG